MDKLPQPNSPIEEDPRKLVDPTSRRYKIYLARKRRLARKEPEPEPEE